MKICGMIVAYAIYYCTAMVHHGAFTLSQAVQLFDMSKSSIPKLPKKSVMLENIENVQYMGNIQQTNKVFASCDDGGMLHIFVHNNSTILGCVWGTDSTAMERSQAMADLRQWHADTIEPVVGRTLDAQLYMVEDVRAWWGV